MRQDPDKLYRAHLLSVECESPAHRDRRPLADQSHATQAHWTQVALAAAGLIIGHGNDAALYRIARSILGDDRMAATIPESRAELYWTLLTWSRMSGAMAEGVRAGGPLTADPGALCGALRILGTQTVEVLLGPLLHPGEAEVAVAGRLKRHIYSAGNSVEPSAAYAAFRGRAATVMPLLLKRGLLQSEPV